MKKTGVLVGIIFIASVLFMLMLTSTVSGRAPDCYTPPVNLAGKPAEGTPTVGDSSLFAQFQSASTFSEADRAEQKKNAATIVSIGSQREEKFSRHDLMVAVGTAFQESNMLNLPHQGSKNDHNSLGLYQQQLGMGYGSASEIMDINHSINTFYDRLATVKNRDSMSLIEVAIKVQIPDPRAYYSRWDWDELAEEIVNTYISSSPSEVSTCATSVGAVDTGDFRLPLDPGYVVSFGGGFNDPNRAVKPHKGIDFSGYPGGSLGKPVYSMFAGTVVMSPAGRGCAGDNSLVVVHDNGIRVAYMHMNGNNVTVRVGDQVTAGQRIGAIASCGNSTGPHLHVEMLAGTNTEAWIESVPKAYKFGLTFLDPAAVMAHYGVDLLP